MGAMHDDARFADALALTALWHGGQLRKGTPVPYVSHLLSVCTLVLDDGGDDDEAIAALLHDAIEDTEHTAAEIAERFGERVSEIVVACTDADPPAGERKPPWKPRKDTYIAHLASRSDDPGIIRVSAADKLANVRTILADHRKGAPGLWDRFKGGLGGSVWYYRELAAVLTKAQPGGHLTNQLRQEVELLTAVALAVAERLEGSPEAISEVLNQLDAPLSSDSAAPWLALELARRLALRGAPWPFSEPLVVDEVVRDVMARWYRGDIAGDKVDTLVGRLQR
jgi:(p)ppGpp synthase/HD superfamily hydrolase